MRTKLILVFVFSVLLLIALPFTLSAAQATYSDTVITANGFDYPDAILDGVRDTYSITQDSASVTVYKEGGIHGIYVVHYSQAAEWYITDPSSGTTVACGIDGFVQEFVDINASLGTTPDSLVLTFTKGAAISDIYVFSQGALPDFVHQWKKPLEKADLMLVAAHLGDENLYFAGLLPYYSAYRGVGVQVVYATSISENSNNLHSQLDALWSVGIRNYPISSGISDIYPENLQSVTDLEQSKVAYSSAGAAYDSFVKFFSDNIRRCKPLVVVSHDKNGEYGNGSHLITASAVKDAVRFSADSSYDTESAITYGGAWCVEKLYLHQHTENQVSLDFDEPLEMFDGRSSFVMSQNTYASNFTQADTYFNEWLCGTVERPITSASQIKDHSPTEYGLYFTRIGEDNAKNDLFENVKLYTLRENEDNAGDVFGTIMSPSTLSGEYSTVLYQSEPLTDEIESDDGRDSKSNVITAVVIVSILLTVALGVFIVFSSFNATNNKYGNRAKKRRR